MKVEVTVKMSVDVPDDVGISSCEDAIDQICCLTLGPAVRLGMGEVAGFEVSVDKIEAGPDLSAYSNPTYELAPNSLASWYRRLNGTENND